jgi:chromate transporter
MAAPSGLSGWRAGKTPLHILLVFLRLGCASFGGPVAHLGYFRAEFVERRRWLSDRAYLDLVALSQFLPGPASSQTGFGIGLMRGGLAGGLAAWLGFTLPSAVAMVAFASLFTGGAGGLAGSAIGAGLLHGLKLVAVAIVAQAVMGMARSQCADRARAAIATLALVAVLLAPASGLPASQVQIAVIVGGGVAGWRLCGGADDGDDVDGARPDPARNAAPLSRRLGWACLIAFFALLALTWAPASGPAALFGAFYRAGALVFGGGHVVLPLLHDALVAPGWVSDGDFLAGYGAAQAAPGPLFTVAAYLGAVASLPPAGTTTGLAGAALALLAIFLPGLLCLAGALPFWHALRRRPAARAAMRGTNAAVVGLLGAALYDPVWTGAVRRPADFAVAAAGFALLVAWRAPPLLVVALSASAGMALGMASGVNG